MIYFNNRFREALGVIYISFNLNKANGANKGKFYEILAHLRQICLIYSIKRF